MADASDRTARQATALLMGVARRTVVVQCTPPSAGNPYYTVLGPYLKELGVDVRYTTDREEVTALFSNGQASVVHFHQLEPFYRGEVESATKEEAASLVNWILRLRLGGARLVYTGHNRHPHDGLFIDIDRYLTRVTTALANRVVVLGKTAASHFESLASEQKIRVVPHPSFVGTYGPPVDRRHARNVLAIDEDEWVALSLGGLRSYKGHDLMIEAFELAQLPSSRLLIVGPGHADPGYSTALEQRVNDLGGRRYRLVIRQVPDDEMALWLAAADVSVFGFREILMSGSMMLSLSYGLPVVVPELGCLPEYVTEGENGLLYDPADQDSLARALHRAHRNAIARDAVLASVEHLHPRKVAPLVAELYRETTT
jgi:glycosyltransferase involved in cell wall biosynthesis